MTLSDPALSCSGPVNHITWRCLLIRTQCPTTETGVVVIGGKSTSGRVASLIADMARVARLVCLGYPFHPTDKPDRLRVEHLQAICTPTLILHGNHDPFGSREEVEGYPLSSAVTRRVKEAGDYWIVQKRGRKVFFRGVWHPGHSGDDPPGASEAGSSSSVLAMISWPYRASSPCTR